MSNPEEHWQIKCKVACIGIKFSHLILISLFVIFTLLIITKSLLAKYWDNKSLWYRKHTASFHLSFLESYISKFASSPVTEMKFIAYSAQPSLLPSINDYYVGNTCHHWKAFISRTSKLVLRSYFQLFYNNAFAKVSNKTCQTCKPSCVLASLVFVLPSGMIKKKGKSQKRSETPKNAYFFSAEIICCHWEPGLKWHGIKATHKCTDFPGTCVNKSWIEMHKNLSEVNNILNSEIYRLLTCCYNDNPKICGRILVSRLTFTKGTSFVKRLAGPRYCVWLMSGLARVVWWKFHDSEQRAYRKKRNKQSSQYFKHITIHLKGIKTYLNAQRLQKKQLHFESHVTPVSDQRLTVTICISCKINK